jgi:hypothetical protein
MNLFEKIFGVRCVDCESHHKRIKGVDYQNINDFCSCGGSNPDFSQMVWSIHNPKELRKCMFYDRRRNNAIRR